MKYIFSARPIATLKYPPFGTMGDVAQIWQLLQASTTFPWIHQDEEEGRE